MSGFTTNLTKLRYYTLEPQQLIPNMQELMHSI